MAEALHHSDSIVYKGCHCVCRAQAVSFRTPAIQPIIIIQNDVRQRAHLGAAGEEPIVHGEVVDALSLLHLLPGDVNSDSAESKRQPSPRLIAHLLLVGERGGALYVDTGTDAAAGCWY